VVCIDRLLFTFAGQSTTASVQNFYLSVYLPIYLYTSESLLISMFKVQSSKVHCHAHKDMARNMGSN